MRFITRSSSWEKWEGTVPHNSAVSSPRGRPRVTQTPLPESLGVARCCGHWRSAAANPPGAGGANGPPSPEHSAAEPPRGGGMLQGRTAPQCLQWKASGAGTIITSLDGLTSRSAQLGSAMRALLLSAAFNEVCSRHWGSPRHCPHTAGVIDEHHGVGHTSGVEDFRLIVHRYDEDQVHLSRDITRRKDGFPRGWGRGRSCLPPGGSGEDDTGPRSHAYLGRCLRTGKGCLSHELPF